MAIALNLGKMLGPLANIALQVQRGERAPYTLPQHPRAAEGYSYAPRLSPNQFLKPTDPIPFSEVSPAMFTKTTLLGGLASFGQFVLGAYGSKGGTVAKSALAPEPVTTSAVAGYIPGGTKTMGLFDDIWGGVQSAASTFFPTDQGINWGSIVNQGANLALTALAPRPAAATYAPAAVAPAAMAGAVPMAARAGAVVARGFFNRFPNLATAIQTLRNSGMNVTRTKLYGVMKRFGPEFLVSGGLLTAAAVNELAVAGPGYRRMNPANVRALRRSVRRIESFHRLCKTTDRLRSTRRHSKKY